ncbi:MAG TPA: exodeoxyribonuclease III [Chromatiaceae bacterium]|jgi:exodeoxyribonuclease-3|nr:MAG: hypothetical protein N838_23045 [Thiohalocapsa sp. PB-PSB1]QQO56950.1 MAG: exodeoxyribonuclease III [Thiohalocapsa sp. PB-PSB1]HBG94314.1 exodeoxyribonuclease III [Chromatiaceae bacterium]HCS89804.1 exodeoxyribonuclease III [Chromatiaceae bacterium]
MKKLVSFNVNGIRSRPHQLAALTERLAPDLIGIQESKVADDAFPHQAIEALGYRAQIHGQKGHYGVALLSREAPLRIDKGFPGDEADAQRRSITGFFADGDDQIVVINGYFPQGESRNHPIKFPGKQRFYADLLGYLRECFSPNQNLVVMGDMNVAPLDLDIGIGDDNARRWLRTGKCSFLPEERAWLRAITDWGLFDAYRVVHPEADDCFSWFDYRSRGFERDPKRGLRIDLILISAPLKERLRGAGIDYGIRALQKPSDHCPVWIELS